MTSLVLTVTETLRYRGKLGQWSWALHRFAGLGTLLFVVLHIIDTSWAAFYPDLYTRAIMAYKTPIFTIGEFGLVACVVYHGLNGFRIVIFDWRPKWWRYQADAAKLVFLVTAVILVPTFVIMFGHVVNYYQTEVQQFDLGLALVVESQLPFAIGIVAVIIAAIVVSVGASILPGMSGPLKATHKRSRFDQFMWTFMRVSGVIIIPLAFGHLAMVHVINGVFDISKVGHVPLWTNLGPSTGAADFVALRWNTMVAGVAIWRLYDGLMLALIVVHGFNGARYVVNDYIHNRIVNRGLRIALLGATIGYIVVGGLALFNTIPQTTEKLIKDTSQVTTQDK